MSQVTGKSEASIALDDYLELLLSSDETMACERLSSVVVPLSCSKLHHLDVQSSRQSTEIESNSESISVDDRRNLERVERLLEDYNRRQKVIETVAEPLEEPLESTVYQGPLSNSIALTSPGLLQPALIVDDKTDDVSDVADEHNAKTADHGFIAKDLQQRKWIAADKIIEREAWSNDDFQSLLFDVGGLKLALPLVKLGGIHRIENDGDITPVFGKPDWFLGLTPSLSGNVKVVDTARWVMPNKYSEFKESGLGYQFILILDDSHWGLACSNLVNKISLSPDNVRWRETAGKRPWLMGMLMDEMCGLLDVDTLIYLFEENYQR